MKNIPSATSPQRISVKNSESKTKSAMKKFLKNLKKLGRNPDWGVVMGNYVFMYVSIYLSRNNVVDLEGILSVNRKRVCKVRMHLLIHRDKLKGIYMWLASITLGVKLILTYTTKQLFKIKCQTLWRKFYGFWLYDYFHARDCYRKRQNRNENLVKEQEKEYISHHKIWIYICT